MLFVVSVILAVLKLGGILTLSWWLVLLPAAIGFAWVAALVGLAVLVELGK